MDFNTDQCFSSDWDSYPCPGSPTWSSDQLSYLPTRDNRYVPIYMLYRHIYKSLHTHIIMYVIYIMYMIVYMRLHYNIYTGKEVIKSCLMLHCNYGTGHVIDWERYIYCRPQANVVFWLFIR